MEPNHLRMFVRGACEERMDREPSFCPDLQGFTQRTLEVVWAYLEGRKTLDGSCSDFECWLAHEAAKVFGWPNERQAVYSLDVHEDRPSVWVVDSNEQEITRMLGGMPGKVRITYTGIEPGMPGIDYTLPQDADAVRTVVAFLLSN